MRHGSAFDKPDKANSGAYTGDFRNGRRGAYGAGTV